jgi:hypothetical protein
MSIQILHNGSNYYIHIPVQYIGDYQIESFDFQKGLVQIGDYKILLEREMLAIHIALNTSSDEYGNTKGQFKAVYAEDNGRVKLSKMKEPIIKSALDNPMNQYNISIERILHINEAENIISEYTAGNIQSHMEIWYTAVIDTDECSEAGMMDDFEIEVKFK